MVTSKPIAMYKLRVQCYNINHYILKLYGIIRAENNFHIFVLNNCTSIRVISNYVKVKHS